jgi:hypothetical protein
LAVSCGGDSGSSDDDYAAAIDAVRAAVATEADTWASGLAAQYRAQAAATGTIDNTAILREIVGPTAKLGDAACLAMKAHKDVAKDRATDRYADAEAAISPVIEEAAMRAIARDPATLKAIGMTQWGLYPPFILKEPTPAADPAVEPTAASLAERIKPEYLAQEGGLKLPGPSDRGYQDFQQWYSQDLKNKLAAEALVSTAPITDEIRGCLSGLQGSKDK